MHFNKQFFVWILSLHQIFSTGFAGVLLKNIQNCNPNGTNAFVYDFTIKTMNKEQYLIGNMSLQRTFDNNLKMNISVEILTGKEYAYLFTARENKACDAMHKYLGEFIYTLERGFGLIPRACPLPKGNYHLYNLPIDANKITTTRNFPFGNLRLIVEIFDGKNHVISCLKTEIENHILYQ